MTFRNFRIVVEYFTRSVARMNAIA